MTKQQSDEAIKQKTKLKSSYRLDHWRIAEKFPEFRKLVNELKLNEAKIFADSKLKAKYNAFEKSMTKAEKDYFESWKRYEAFCKKEPHNGDGQRDLFQKIVFHGKFSKKRMAALEDFIVEWDSF